LTKGITYAMKIIDIEDSQRDILLQNIRTYITTHANIVKNN